jgi:hypothetical protein
MGIGIESLVTVSPLEIEDGGFASQFLFYDASTTVGNQVAQQLHF